MNDFFDNFKRGVNNLFYEIISTLKFLATPKGVDFLITIIIVWFLIFGVIVFLIEILM